MKRDEHLSCVACGKTYDLNDLRYRCNCNGLLEIAYAPSYFEKLHGYPAKAFDPRLSSRVNIDRSGVWRFREGLIQLSPGETVTHPEGQTGSYTRKSLSDFAGHDIVSFKHEGENPTGSFKDRGMTVAISQAKRLGVGLVGCASTGNTSASLACYASHAGLPAIVFVPEGKIARGKLAQALGFGATCLAVRGDFDDAMKLIQTASQELGVYMVNSLNPFRLEGQKTIIWELLQDLEWQAPDWIFVPGGNLGNTSAFGKAFHEAHRAGWIDKIPRIAVVQAFGASPFYQSFKKEFSERIQVAADTIATAIQIGNPVNYEKAKRSVETTAGVVTQVSDQLILEAKKAIDRSGIGCEPASACALAGLKKLRAEGVVKAGESVACVLTGHMLKDSEVTLTNSMENAITEVDPNLSAVERALAKHA